MKEFLPIFNEELPLYQQLYEYVKQEITTGKLNKDDKLPSIRGTSQSIGISKTTVKTAFEQLMIEGYIYSKERSGYFVSDAVSLEIVKRKEKVASIEASSKKYPLEIVDEEIFDFNKWKKCTNQVFSYKQRELLKETEIQGELELREEIGKYLYEARGVICNKESIVIGAGVSQLTPIIATIFKAMSCNTIAFEDPGFLPSQRAFEDLGFEISLLEVDESGIEMEELNRINPQLVYLSPSHQFPTGSLMSASRRVKVLSWAKANNSFIIEDDYDSELRYNGKPVPSLKSLDNNERVIYLGSFSSTLFPAVRISYMVLPPQILEKYLELSKNYPQGCSKVDQMIMTEFMKEGYYQKHIRRIRRLYNEKLNGLKKCVERTCIKVTGDDAGQYAVIEINLEAKEDSIAEIFNNSPLKILPLKNFMIKNSSKKYPRYMLYFYSVPLEDIEEHVLNLDKKLKAIL